MFFAKKDRAEYDKTGKQAVLRCSILLAAAAIVTLAFFSLSGCSRRQMPSEAHDENLNQNADILPVTGSTLPEAQEEAKDTPARDESSLAVTNFTQSILSFDWEAVRIDPSVYLREKIDLQGKSWHDMSAIWLLGFSQDGAVAFLQEVERDGVGCSQAVLTIQDLVSDEILWELKSPSDDGYDLQGGVTARFIRENGDAIDAKLALYNVRLMPCSYEALPYTTIDAYMQVRENGRLWNDMFPLVDYSCIAVDESGRKKTVTSKKDVAAADALVCGYVKSPFEERLALVIAEAAYGFEGCDLLYSVVGCDIKKGFE